MHLQASPLPVIQPRSSQLFVVEIESKRLDQMKPGAYIGGEPDDIPGIRRYLGLIEDDINHAESQTAH